MSQTTKGEIQNMLHLLAEKILEKAHQEAEEDHIPTRQAIMNLGFAQNAPYRWLKGEILRVDRDRILTLCLFQGLLTEAEKGEMLAKLDAFWVNEWDKRYRKKSPEQLTPQSSPIASVTPEVTFEAVIKAAESFKSSLEACNQRKKEFLELFGCLEGEGCPGIQRNGAFPQYYAGDIEREERF